MDETFDFPHWRFAAGGKGRGRGRARKLDDLERLVAIGQAARGGHFGGGPMFGPPRGRARRRRGDVRTAILLLLADEPRNGYQLMQAIEERSDGRWRPSPGSVYPTLAQLEDEWLIRATEHVGTKLFELTDAGRERAGEAAAAPWEADDDDDTPDMRGLIGQVAGAAMLVSRGGTEGQVEEAIETLKSTRRSLYRILAEDEDV
jgi:DNA-binding PadR family transcriptional regulator